MAFVHFARERFWERLLAAWREPRVRMGFYGTLLITLGSLTPAYLPQTSPWWRVLDLLHVDGPVARIVGTLMVLGGLALLVEAWFRLRPHVASRHAIVAYHHLSHWAVLGIWSAPFLLAPPIFSHDAYSYAAQGWLIHNGIDPYLAGPGTLPGSYADQVAWEWRFTPAPYGPLSLQLGHLMVDVTGHDPYASAVLMRIPALLGVIAIGLLVPRVARFANADPAVAAWFATLNPVLVIDFVGGAHNDAMMMGLVVLALWLATRGRRTWLVAAMIIGVAAAFKQPAFLAAVVLPLLMTPWGGWEIKQTIRTAVRVAVSLIIAVAVFAAISVLSGLGFGWWNAVNVPGLVVTVSPATVIGQGLQLVLNVMQMDPTGHAAIRLTRSVALVLATLIVVLLWVRVAPKRPLAFLSWGYLSVAFLAPALHSWYVLWGGLLLPLTKLSNRVLNVAVWTTVILLSYAAINLSWRNGAISLGVAALMGYLWQAHVHGSGLTRRLNLRRQQSVSRPTKTPHDSDPS